jgi:hypothetical protein
VEQRYKSIQVYSQQTKLNYLIPNELININQDTNELYRKIMADPETFFSYVTLFHQQIKSAIVTLQVAELAINKVITNLEQYQKEMK